jgi:hypothetical protein
MDCIAGERERKSRGRCLSAVRRPFPILAVVGLEQSGSGEPRPIATAGAAIELAIVLQNDLILVLRETGTPCK